MKKESYLLKFRYKIETFLLRILFCFFKILGIRAARFVCGTIAMLIGLFFPPSWLAFRNLSKAFPKKSFLEKIKILLGMWNNLGSFIGEYGNIYNFRDDTIFQYTQITEQTQKNLEELKSLTTGAILFSGHIANWEIGLKVLEASGIKNLKVVYRGLNNKYADKFISTMRKNKEVEIINKDKNSGLKIFKALKQGAKLVMLVDQRLGGGITIPFFNHPAKTVDSVGVFALKCKVPVYPIRVIRKGMGSNFELELSKNLTIRETKDFNKDVKRVMISVNSILEQWIKEYPEQWFWVHNRWRI